MRRNMLKAFIVIISFSFLFTSLNLNTDSNSNIVPNNGGKLPPLPSPGATFSIL